MYFRLISDGLPLVVCYVYLLHDMLSSVYKGKFKDDKLNGRGTMNCTDGSRYDGMWCD